MAVVRCDIICFNLLTTLVALMRVEWGNILLLLLLMMMIKNYCLAYVDKTLYSVPIALNLG